MNIVTFFETTVHSTIERLHQTRRVHLMKIAASNKLQVFSKLRRGIIDIAQMNVSRNTNDYTVHTMIDICQRIVTTFFAKFLDRIGPKDQICHSHDIRIVLKLF